MARTAPAGRRRAQTSSIVGMPRTRRHACGCWRSTRRRATGSVALLRDDASSSSGRAMPALVARRAPAGGLRRRCSPRPGSRPPPSTCSPSPPGPARFTGLRIGLAAMQGLALALDRPAAGVSSLAGAGVDGLRERARRCRPRGAWLDASRGEVFAAAYRRPGAGAGAWPLDGRWPRRRPRHRRDTPRDVGTASSRRRRRSSHACQRMRRGTRPRRPPAIAGTGAAGRRRGADRLADARAWGSPGPPHALAPEYVRRPDVEIDARPARGDPPAPR